MEARFAQAAFKVLVSKVETRERHAVPWASACVDAGAHREGVWRAVQQHETQIAIYGTLSELTPEQHREIWGGQTFYRVLSHVNGGRQLETDLFAGIKSPATHRDPETADGHYPAR